MAQSHVLSEIRRMPLPSIQRVADALGMDITTLSRQIKALELKGLVERKVSLDDRRVSVLSLSESGHSVLNKIDRYMADRLGRIFGTLTDFERETVVRSLGLLNQAVVRSEMEGAFACCK